MNNSSELHKTQLTTISISKKNYETLKQLGYTGESFNDVLGRVLERAQLMAQESN